MKSVFCSHLVRSILLLGALSALSLGGYLIASRIVYRLGFPLDDAWIHQTYARNLAQGEWAFIPGEPSGGSTAPLWSALLAPGAFLGIGPLAWSFVLGWLLLWALAVLAENAWQARRLQQTPGATGQGRFTFPIAGALFALEWHLVWAAGSGMETLLFTLLVGLVLALVLRAHPPWFWAGFLVGMSAWVRPEGITLLAVLGLAILIQGDWRGKGFSGPLRIASLAGGGFALAFVPYLVFNQAVSGSWWPNTLSAKPAEYALYQQRPYLARLLDQAVLPLVGVGAMLLPGYIFTLVRFVRRREWLWLAASIWPLGILGLYAWRLPVVYQHGRYAIPAMAVYFWFGLDGLRFAVASARAAIMQRILARAWALSTTLVLLVFWAFGARAYAQDVALIESEMVAVARWVAQNTQPQDLIAAHDIGALGYFGERRLLDLAGLVSPQVIPFIRDETALASYLDAQRADYLVTFPGWYPQLTARARLVYQISSPYAPSQGGENMAVYRWEKTTAEPGSRSSVGETK